MKKLLMLVSVAATLLVGLSAQSQQLSQVYIVYVRSGDAEDDKKSMEALQYTVNSLNTSGGRAAGYNYNLHDVPTIADAVAFTASRSQNGIAQVEAQLQEVRHRAILVRQVVILLPGPKATGRLLRSTPYITIIRRWLMANGLPEWS